MKDWLNLTWSRYLLAALAGLLLAAAFPKFSVAGFAWIAPALLLGAARGHNGWSAFRIGYVGALVSALVQYYWLLRIPVTGFPILGWVALSSYLALFPAVWVWLNPKIITENSELENTWSRRTFRALLGAAIWVALEMAQARLFTGMPWNLLGNSQYTLTPLIQFASATGAYGVSFLVVWSSLSLLNAGLAVVRQPAQRFIWQAEIILPLVAVIALFWSGTMKIRANETGDPAIPPSLRVTFVQPSIPQTMIWNPADSGRRFAQLLNLTRIALSNETDLLLWPEAALPSVGQAELAALTGLVREHQVWMLLGADDVRSRPGMTNADDKEYFNAAVLLNPRGETTGVYHKRKLVMFGEFVPATRSLPFLKHLTPITGGFTPGDRAVQFETLARERAVKFSSLICFEDIFPNEARRYVEDDTDFLVNLTNDGWFGESAAHWQQAAAGVFRAVENGLPLLRCCNNGLTCWVDEHGVMRKIFRDKSGSEYGAGVMTAQIPLLSPGQKRVPTFYHRYGDWFGWLCVALAAPVLLARLPKLPRRKWGDV